MWWWVLFGIMIVGTMFIESAVVRVAIGAAFGLGTVIYHRFRRANR